MSDSIIFMDGCNSCKHWRKTHDPDIGICVNEKCCEVALKARLDGHLGRLFLAAWWKFQCHELDERYAKDCNSSKSN
jgi:hypothetical protein